MASRSCGSSPLTRGAPVAPPVRDDERGIIPAHAGSTIWAICCWACCWDHPRSRGEHPFRVAAGGCAGGSSPLTRGARDDRSADVVQGRIIPAHAGSTRVRYIGVMVDADHPRSRGEHAHMVTMPVARDGSSPLTRGAQASGWGIIPVTGIIPAHAGSTRPALTSPSPAGDHPRSRGEHATTAMNARPALGSSPLTRGAHSQWGGNRLYVRIIPAHAGSTRQSPPS